MDDFGTGYSSLGYLTRFPFDKIKIDQSFVRDIDKPESRAVVSAVLGISRALNIAVIAEGVETVEQYQLLQEEGCSQMQGYLFSRPRPAGELPLLLLAVSQKMQRLNGEALGAPAGRRLVGDGQG
jgi:EAL domain-containing protein (putative c-di-GMP-specific phosphodiesterase class I)